MMSRTDKPIHGALLGRSGSELGHSLVSLLFPDVGPLLPASHFPALVPMSPLCRL